MCGITGVLTASAGDRARLETLVEAMAQTIAHRGPDDRGTWVHADAGLALGHRRLAIVDLSVQGHQPMSSADGRYVISYNGEIYNFLVLAHELEAAGAAPRWRGHSDTEVLLAAIAHWGFPHALDRLVGMFAFALWDRQERALYLARDRLGEKPLYYGLLGREFAFGSELKALAAHPGWSGEIDRAALAEYVRYSYVPVPRSIYRGIAKLPGGCYLRMSAADVRARQIPEPVAYWSLAQVAQVAQSAGAAAPANANDAIDELAALLRQSVAQQTIVDVPFGAFLSGGVDSSTVVAVMQSQISKPVRTFSIGFSEVDYNEADFARGVARHLGTDHTQLYVSPREAQSVITRLPAIYDEPFADSSQIPTLLVSQLARPSVKVALTGDGGDELFGGYVRYTRGESILRKFGWMPAAVRRGVSRALTAASPATWDAAFGFAGPLVPASLRVSLVGDKIHKYAALVSTGNETQLYRELMAPWPGADPVLGVGAIEDDSPVPGGSLAERMMFRDVTTYLPDDILAKVDRAAMSVGLETRLPLLDHRIVEFAWRLPRAMKIRRDGGKWLLRQVLHRYVPRALVDRPKMPFAVPLDQWLRGPLVGWADALLDPSRLRREGFLDPGPITTAWREHRSGQRNWQFRIWTVLMFQTWLQDQKDLIRTPHLAP